MKNNLLKMALSLGMIVSVSGMQDASCMESSDTISDKNTIIISDTDKMKQNMNNINNEFNQNSESISDNMKNIKRINKKIQKSKEKGDVVFFEDFEKSRDKKDQILKKQIMAGVKDFKKSLVAKYNSQFSLDNKTKQNIAKFLDTNGGDYFVKHNCSYNELHELVKSMNDLQHAKDKILKSDNGVKVSNAANEAATIVNQIINVTNALDNKEQPCKETSMSLIASIKNIKSAAQEKYARFINEKEAVESELNELTEQIENEPALLEERIAKLKAESEENKQLWKKQKDKKMFAREILQKIEPDYNTFKNYVESANKYQRLFSYIKASGKNILSMYQQINAYSQELNNNENVQKLLDENLANQTMVALDGIEDDGVEYNEKFKDIPEQGHEEEEYEQEEHEEEDEKEVNQINEDNDDNNK
jgi:hypothetical protein